MVLLGLIWFHISSKGPRGKVKTRRAHEGVVQTRFELDFDLAAKLRAHTHARTNEAKRNEFQCPVGSTLQPPICNSMTDVSLACRGTKYSSRSRKPGNMQLSGPKTLTWRSDGSVTNKGFKICVESCPPHSLLNPPDHHDLCPRSWPRMCALCGLDLS